MEQIVRPFQWIDPTATIRVDVAPTQVTVSSSRLCWGAAGNLPTAVQQEENFNGVNFKLEECGEHYAEITRATEDLRIEQPGKPDNYVIDRRIRKMEFKKTSKQKFLGVFHTDTTDFGLPDFFAGSGFGDVQKQDKCHAIFYFDQG
jgi:hypothetical protein